MPYRCRSCQKLSSAELDNDCPVQEKCHFEKVDVIHFVTPNGVGPVIGNASFVVMGEDQKRLIEKKDVKLGCTTKATNPMFTDVRYAVTCLACLNNHPVPIEVTEEE